MEIWSLEQWNFHSNDKRVFYIIDSFFQNNSYFTSILNENKILNVVYLDSKNAKKIESVLFIWEELLKLNFGKQDYLMGIGGGSISDLTTFIAGTYKRGINHFLLPTTLLAASDAAIGGKGGIDFYNTKNTIGIIKQPLAMIIHQPIWASLSANEKQWGWAEVVKHALIGADNIFDELVSNKFLHETKLISSSIQFKNSIVEQDLFEHSLRKILNFGHTLGHAWESYQMEIGQEVCHGEAVVEGMRKELELMNNWGYLSNSEWVELTSFINDCFGNSKRNIQWNKVIEAVKNDKKNEGNTIGFVQFCGRNKTPQMIQVSFEQLQQTIA
jgi:3-dehydroquinate synthase